MNPLTVTVWDTVALIIGAFLLGHRVGLHRRLVPVQWLIEVTIERRRTNRAVDQRMAASDWRALMPDLTPQPAPLPVVEVAPPLPAGVELVHIGGRETPAPAPVSPADPFAPAGVPAMVRGQDREPCADPCMARHCAHHNAPGTPAQNGGFAHTQAVRAALFTPTAEWPQVVQSLLGLVVPGDLSTLYADVT